MPTAGFLIGSVQIHIEAKQEDRIAIRLELPDVRIDALLTREERSWVLQYVGPNGNGKVNPVLSRERPWQTALRVALAYCEQRLTVAPLTDGSPQ